jgi:hypothetical protein
LPPTPTPVEEKYEAVVTADYEPNMELSGRIQWDENGLVNGGPVDSFSFWGQKLELTSNMITDGFLSTKDYGKIMMKANANGSMHIELTPSQQKKIMQLKATLPAATQVLPAATSLPPTLTPTPVQLTGSPDQTEGRIVGRVYRSDTNQAITNATVVLIDATKEPSPPFGLLFNPQVAQTRVSAQGHFLFAVVKPGIYILALQGTSSRSQDFPFCDSGSTPSGWETLALGGQTGSIEVIATNMGVNQRFNVAVGKVVQKDLTVQCN